MGEYKELFIVACISEHVCASSCCRCTFVWRGVEISLCMLTSAAASVHFKKNECVLSCVQPRPRRFLLLLLFLEGGLLPAAASCLSHSEPASALIETWKSPHTEEDCCHDLWLWVLSLVEWEHQQPGARSGRGGSAGKTSAQGATCSHLILDIFGDPTENWWKENIELILVKIEEPVVWTHTHRHAGAHKHTRVRLRTHTAYDTCNPSLLWFLSWWGLEESRRG